MVLAKKNHKEIMEKKELLLGAHMSVAGGYEQAILQGESIECSAIQLFTKSNRQWIAKPIEQNQTILFQTTLQKSKCIQFVMAHASYLINVASSDPDLEKKSIESLREELERCNVLGIPFLVLHPGSSPHIDQALERISKNITIALKNTPNNRTTILLENTAGQGSSIGSTFEQLRTIYNGIAHQEKIGFCFDTCHAFAAGYDFTTPEKYEKFWKYFDDLIGIKQLKAFHINDSLKGLGSHVDRHAHIGQGKIGLEAFSLLMNDPRFSTIPKILETPKEEGLQEDLMNLATLKGLIKN